MPNFDRKYTGRAGFNLPINEKANLISQCNTHPLC